MTLQKQSASIMKELIPQLIRAAEVRVAEYKTVQHWQRHVA